MPIKVLKKDENKTIPVSHSKDHPDVKTTENIIKKDREKAKEDFPILSKVFGTGNPKKDIEKAKRVADTLQTMASKMRTKTEGSFKKGGLSAGQKKIAAKAPPPDKITGADFAVLKKEKAKGRGMGLQDEKLKPGKVYKANKGMSFSEKMTLQDAKVIDKKTGKTHLSKDQLESYLKSQKDPKLQKMGQLEKKYIKQRPSMAPKASDILKKKKLPGAIGTALGIGAMMVPAAYGVMKQYKDYKSAKNRDEAKVKKMGGGMAKKYSVGGGADMSKVKTKKKNILDKVTDTLNKAGEAYKKLGEAGLNVLRGNTKGQPFPAKKMVGGMAKKYNRGGGADMGAKRDFDKITERTKIYAKAESMKDTDRLTNRDIQEATKALKPSQRKSRRYAATPGYLPKPAIGKMGGGMMQRPMGYKSGTMVKARGCKLGRTRPTKMY